MPYCAASLWMAASYSSNRNDFGCSRGRSRRRQRHPQAKACHKQGEEKKLLIVPSYSHGTRPSAAVVCPTKESGASLLRHGNGGSPSFLSFLPEILDTCGNDQNYHNGLQNATQSTYYHHKHIRTSFPARQHISHWPLSMWGFFFYSIAVLECICQFPQNKNPFLFFIVHIIHFHR